MKIETLKELEALVKMCNKHGVSNIEIDGIKMRLAGAENLKTELPDSKPSTPDQYSEEDILMWSVPNVG